MFLVFFGFIYGEKGVAKSLPNKWFPFLDSRSVGNSKGISKSKNEENFTWGLCMQPKKSLEKVKISQGKMWPNGRVHLKWVKEDKMEFLSASLLLSVCLDSTFLEIHS